MRPHGEIRIFMMIRHAQSGNEPGQPYRLFGVVIPHVQVNRMQMIVDGHPGSTIRQKPKEGKAVLSPGQSHQDAVAILDHIIPVNALTGQPLKFFLEKSQKNTCPFNLECTIPAASNNFLRVNRQSYNVKKAFKRIAAEKTLPEPYDKDGQVIRKVIIGSKPQCAPADQIHPFFRFPDGSGFEQQFFEPLHTVFFA